MQYAADVDASVVTFGLVSPDENNKNYWKQFANNPTLTVRYSYAIDAPGVWLGDARVCNGVSVAATHFPRVVVVGQDRNPYPLGLRHFVEVNRREGGLVASGQVEGASGQQVSWSAPWLDDGDYLVRARSETVTQDGTTQGSGWSAWVDVTVDSERPDVPGVWSSVFPDSTSVGGDVTARAGEFALTGSADRGHYRGDRPAGFAYSWVDAASVPVVTGCLGFSPTSHGGVVAANPWGDAAIPFPVGLGAGPHALFVRAVDASGNASDLVDFDFVVEPDQAHILQFEAEDMVFDTDAIDTRLAQGYWPVWSGDKARFVGTDQGQQVTFSFAVDSAGWWQLRPRISTNVDHGIVGLAVDGQRVEQEWFDELTGQEFTTPVLVDAFSMMLGTITRELEPMWLSQGVHSLTFIAEGRNPSSEGFLIEVDKLSLKRVEQGS